MIKRYLDQVVAGDSLTCAEAQEAMMLIMSGQCTDVQIGAFLTALRIKGETVDEITGLAIAMRSCANPFPGSFHFPLVDTCGTGGDASGTFNVSTCTALVAAGAGAYVAKHGNRAVSSLCGSADVLTKLGVVVDLPIDRVSQCLGEVGISFLFAPVFHPAMKHAAAARRDLAMRTVFNLLGPLSNPAGVKRQVIGVYDASLVLPMAEVLKRLGSEHVVVVHGAGGLDEFSLMGESIVAELKPGGFIEEYVMQPDDFGFSSCVLSDLQGGDSEINAQIIEKILQGESGPKRQVVVMNAAVVLYVAGLVDHIGDGIRLAEESIDQGNAWAKLNALREFGRKC